MKNDYLSLYMKPQPNNNASLNYAIFESSRCTLYNVAPIWDHVFLPTWTIKIHCLVIAGLPANNCRLFKYSFGIFEICLKTQTKGPFTLMCFQMNPRQSCCGSTVHTDLSVSHSQDGTIQRWMLPQIHLKTIVLRLCGDDWKQKSLDTST